LPRANLPRSDASHDAHAFASNSGIAGTGSLIAATRLNPTDLWG